MSNPVAIDIKVVDRNGNEVEVYNVVNLYGEIEVTIDIEDIIENSDIVKGIKASLENLSDLLP
jgi:hypothetical protein